jgi:hypothetical protein
MHNQHIASIYWQKGQQPGHHLILRMNVNGVSTIFTIATWVIYIPIGCKHQFMKYWQPLLAKTTVTCPLLHAANECPWSINGFASCMFGNQGIVQILRNISALFTTM